MKKTFRSISFHCIDNTGVLVGGVAVYSYVHQAQSRLVKVPEIEGLRIDKASKSFRKWWV